jgi:hypothetical protein
MIRALRENLLNHFLVFKKELTLINFYFRLQVSKNYMLYPVMQCHVKLQFIASTQSPLQLAKCLPGQ